ncbi:TetR/AcrR family transcriptional regulator [Kribbella sp. NPDC051586]|uniref:TetR/AcrR family transcriptional regulator n=1 Tax=Kribbella sp. NPDC051586 TaxID=3364118 RepID=UPI0037B66D21
MSTSKPLRADARRNRDQLVATARAVFAELGTQAALDEIARRARIGNATLYRHFPTRDDLIVAVYAEEVAELCAVDDGVDLFDWLERFIRHVAEKGDLARNLEPSARRSELHDAWHESMVETAGRLVGRAQRDGRLRPDVDPLDLLVLSAGMATAEPARVKRMLQMLQHGVVTP